MISAIIIDDEKRSCNTLVKLINLCDSEIEILGEAYNIDDGLTLINNTKPDLVFLDINMPGGNGFNLLEKISTIDFKIIFTTAHDEFAISAIKLGAFDYLLKPIALDELEATLIRVKDLSSESKEDYENLLNLILDKNQSPKKIPIAQMNGITFLDSEDIIRCAADNNYTVLHLKNKQQMVSSKTLKDYDNILSPLGFFRAHRSHLINVQYVSKFLKGKPSLIEMQDGYRVELAQNKKSSFLGLFESH